MTSPTHQRDSSRICKQGVSQSRQYHMSTVFSRYLSTTFVFSETSLVSIICSIFSSSLAFGPSWENRPRRGDLTTSWFPETSRRLGADVGSGATATFTAVDDDDGEGLLLACATSVPVRRSADLPRPLSLSLPSALLRPSSAMVSKYSTQRLGHRDEFAHAGVSVRSTPMKAGCLVQLLLRARPSGRPWRNQWESRSRLPECSPSGCQTRFEIGRRREGPDGVPSMNAGGR